MAEGMQVEGMYSEGTWKEGVRQSERAIGGIGRDARGRHGVRATSELLQLHQYDLPLLVPASSRFFLLFLACWLCCC